MTAQSSRVASRHATAIAIGKSGVAIFGPSGAGKSDLALRLIDRGATLICDDRVCFNDDNGQLVASAVQGIAGKLEIRGVGIFAFLHLHSAPVRLCVELGYEGERHPSPWPVREIDGYRVPLLQIDPFAASAPIKVEYAVKSVVDAALWPVPIAGLPHQGKT